VIHKTLHRKLEIEQHEKGIASDSQNTLIHFDSFCMYLTTKSNMTGATTGTGTAYPCGAPEFKLVFSALCGFSISCIHCSKRLNISKRVTRRRKSKERQTIQWSLRTKSSRQNALHRKLEIEPHEKVIAQSPVFCVVFCESLAITFSCCSISSFLCSVL
jgi:hypothetical protein